MYLHPAQLNVTLHTQLKATSLEFTDPEYAKIYSSAELIAEELSDREER